MNNLQVFKSEEFGEVRSLLINNKPWFIGKQVADILGYQTVVEILSDTLMKRIDK